MSRRLRVVGAVAGFVTVLAVPAAASAGLEIRNVEASPYPRAHATVVTSKPSQYPPQLTGGGLPRACWLRTSGRRGASALPSTTPGR
jgi:hypothetical protein